LKQEVIPTMPGQASDKKFISIVQLCARWGDCCEMTVERKLANDPAFPPPIQLTPGGRRLWDLQQIEEYERKAATRSREAAARAPPRRPPRRGGAAEPPADRAPARRPLRNW
jgi:hypothetical protein